MYIQQDTTIFPTSLIRFRGKRGKYAPGQEESASACCGVCREGRPCPFDGCRLDSSAFAGGPRGQQLEFDFGTQH